MKRIRRLLFDRFGWKLLSLAIAVLLWILVASEPEFTTLATVRPQYKNFPENLEISSETVGSISLELRGPSGELRGAGDTGTQPAVVIDMSGVQPGQRTFTIGDLNVRLPSGVHLVRARPSEVRFDFELRSERDVPVRVRFTGEGAHGYVVARESVLPNELPIVGPASRVARIGAVFTDPVDVSDAVGSSEFRVNAFVEDPYVRFRTSPQVVVAVTMARK